MQWRQLCCAVSAFPKWMQDTLVDCSLFKVSWKVFLVAAEKENGLPAYVCRSCRDKAFSVVKRFENMHEGVMRSLVMDRIGESVPRRLAVVQPSLLKRLQLFLQLSEQNLIAVNLAFPHWERPNN